MKMLSDEKLAAMLRDFYRMGQIDGNQCSDYSCVACAIRKENVELAIAAALEEASKP